MLVEHGLQSMFLNTGGDVLIHCFESNDCERDVLERHINMTRKKGVAEVDGVQSLGRVTFEALDYGIDEAKKHPLSHELETLIDFMTHCWYDNCEEGGDTGSQSADDEGFEKYTMEEHHCTFGEVTRLCAQHLTITQDANYHYSAVCQVLFSEVTELKTLLEKIEHSREQLKQVSEAEECRFLALERADCAWLWMQVLHSLRQGVRLKKCQHVSHVSRTSLEVELSPFEILMQDIRFRRYTLYKVMVNGEPPLNVKTYAQSAILDFIRSRPPLRSMQYYTVWCPRAGGSRQTGSPAGHCNHPLSRSSQTLLCHRIS